MNFFVLVIFSFSPLSLLLFLPCLSTYLLLSLLSLFLSFSLPSLSSPSPTPTHVSLFIFLSPLSFLLLCGCLSLPPLYLLVSFSLPPCLSSSVVLSPAPVSLSLSRSYLSFHLFLSLLSLFLSFSRPYLSISLESRSLFQSLSLSLSRSYLSFHLSLSPTPVFLIIFLSHTLSLFLSFLLFSLSHPCLFLLSDTHIFLSLSLCLSLSHPRLFLFLQSLFLSLPLLYLFPSFLPSLSSSSLSPTHVSLSIFVSSLSLLPLCGSFSSTPISLPIFLSHRCLIFSYPSLSLSHASLSLLANMSQSCRMVSTVLYFYYITLIIYILYYLDFKILSFVRDSSYDMYYKGCGLLCAHKKSFNTAIPLPVRSLGPYMYVHYSLSLGRKRT